MMNLTCCVSCGVGSSRTEKDVPGQIEKFGEYICIGCEKTLNAIIEATEEITLDQGYGRPRETLITEDNIYYFEGAKVANPNNSFLGFGGSWYLVAKNYGFKKKVFVTNNLWHSRRIPKGFQNKFKENGKVNSVVIGVSKTSIEDLRNLLNDTPYLRKPEEENK